MNADSLIVAALYTALPLVATYDRPSGTFQPHAANRRLQPSARADCREVRVVCLTADGVATSAIGRYGSSRIVCARISSGRMHQPRFTSPRDGSPDRSR